VHCSSWDLIPLGIGIARVEKALRDVFPHVPLFRGDVDHAPTETQLKKVIAEWKASAQGILLSTERSLAYVDRVPHTAVASLDSLFAVPDFRMHERIFHLLLSLRTRTEKTCTVQTRNPDAPILLTAVKGDVRSFYEQEYAERKQFNYPPFTVLIMIKTQGTLAALKTAEEYLTTHFQEYSPTFFPDSAKHSTNQYLLNALITLPIQHWPNDDLLEKLHALPPSFAVIVDPESIG
jgi:primosomal protein N'